MKTIRFVFGFFNLIKKGADMDIKWLVKKCLPVFLIFLPVVLFAQVNQEWIVSYDGLENREDCGNAIAVSNTGNVYVAGYSYTVSAGQWPHALLIKYDSSGNEQWVFCYDTVSSQLNDIVMDSEENVYVVGSYVASDSFLTMKFDSSGNCLWDVKYGPNGGAPRGRAIAMDSSGNIFITGGFYSPITDWDMLTIKYDNNGNELWVRQYDYEGEDDYAFDLACDDSGNVYITGIIMGNVIGACYGTVKYDSNGNELWTRYYDGHGWGGGGQTQAIDIDNSGNIYVTGYHEDTVTATGQFDYATIKYDTNGNELWAARYNGTGNSGDRASALVVDELGNSYVTGYSEGTTTGSDIVTIKYDSNGNELWVARHIPAFPQGWGSTDEGWDITLDSSGNVYVVGAVDPDSTTSTYWNYSTIKYDTNGNELWVMTYNGSSNEGGGIAFAVAVNNTDVYVTGQSDEVVDGYIIPDCTTIKYSQPPAVKIEKRGKELVIRFDVVPNPFVSYATVLGYEKEKFALYDISGRKISISQGNRIGKGLSAGVYFVKPNNKNAQPVRIVKVR